MAYLAPAAGEDLLGEGFERRQPLRRLVDRSEATEGDHRLVVRAVLEDRAREDEPVEERHGHTRRPAASKHAEHPARGRAVDVDPVGDAGTQHRDADGLSAVDERDVADERAVEDLLDPAAVVAPLLRVAPNSDPVGGPSAHDRRHSRERLARPQGPGSKPSRRPAISPPRGDHPHQRYFRIAVASARAAGATAVS